MEDRELLPVIESLLFVSGEPIALDRLKVLLEGIGMERIKDGLDVLREKYDNNGHGVQLVEVAGGFQIVTRPECAPWIKGLEKVKSATRLSKPALETLSIVAYKQPVIRAEIEQIRGVDSMGVLKTLLERHLIKINGRRDALGRPIMYGTTKEFLIYFGLKGLSDLPLLRDFQEIAQAEPDEVDEMDSQALEGGSATSKLQDEVPEGTEGTKIKENENLETQVSL